MPDGSFRGSDRDMLYQHNRDLYLGNGKAGITTRLNDLEKCDGRREIDMQAIRKDIAVLEDQVGGFNTFVTEVNTQTRVYKEISENRNKRLTLMFTAVGVLIALMMAILTILGIEHVTGKSVINLKSDVQDAYIINLH